MSRPWSTNADQFSRAKIVLFCCHIYNLFCLFAFKITRRILTATENTIHPYQRLKPQRDFQWL